MSPPAKERPREAVGAASQGKGKKPERTNGREALSVYPKEQAPEHVRIRYRRRGRAWLAEVYEW
jgi:hypothetical protein